MGRVSTTRFLLLRHAQSTWNAEGRWQGWGDPPLSPEGVSEVGPVAGWLGHTWPGMAAVVSSDLRRARQTAGPVADRLGVGPVVVDAGLRERDVGAWTGLTTEQIESAWPGQVPALREGRLDRPPGGESTAELLARATAGLDRLRARWPGREVLVVCHGGVIRAVEQHLGAPPLTVPNLSGRWIERATQWRLGVQVAAPSTVVADP